MFFFVPVQRSFQKTGTRLFKSNRERIGEQHFRATPSLSNRQEQLAYERFVIQKAPPTYQIPLRAGCVQIGSKIDRRSGCFDT